MSIKLMSAVFESKTLGPTERLIMLVLADHADDEGKCYPSVSRIKDRTGLSERAVQTNIKKLIDQGYIRVDFGGGKSKSNLYFVSANPAADAPYEVKQTPQQMHPLRPNPAADAANPAADAANPAADAPKPLRTIIEPDGGGSAREPISQSADPTFRERILEASGGDPVSGLTGHGGRRIGTQADMLEAGRWLAMGLTEAECLTEIAAVMAKKRDGPPSKLSYFTPAMQRLAGAKTAPTLSPTNSPAESRSAEPKPFRPDFSKYGVPK
jgi:hypothetical protein